MNNCRNGFWVLSLFVLNIAANNHRNHDCCLTDEQATYIATTWLPLNVKPPQAWLSNPRYNQTADTILAPAFELYSDSDNYVGAPPPNNPAPGTVTATSRADWIEQQVLNESNPDIINITVTILNLVHDCTQIAVRWRYEGYYQYAGPEDGLADVAGDMIGATGFDYLVMGGCPKQIDTVYREFNDLEFSYELGQYICFQRNNQSRCGP